MSTQTDDVAKRLNEIAGMTSALVAIVAQMPEVTPDMIKNARKLIGSLTPGPVAASPAGSAPIHFAAHTLDRIESMGKSLAAVRGAGGP